MTTQLARSSFAGVALALALAFVSSAEAADMLGRVGGALDRTGAYIGRKLGVDDGSGRSSGRSIRSVALVEESRAPAIPTATREAAAATLRAGLDRLDRAETSDERAAAAALVVDAAERGDPDAQYMLGAGDLLLPTGERDPARAAQWLARAAAQGHARAQYALALAYVDGDGVTRDPAWANMWLARAARHGHGQAQYSLALREIAGEGWPSDTVDAYRWLAIAAAAGDAEAERYRKVLAAQLPPEQRLPLDAEAAAFRPVVGPDAWPDPPLVLYVQHALSTRGIDPGPADGAVGARTRTAVRKYAGGGDGTVTPTLVARLRGR